MLRTTLAALATLLALPVLAHDGVHVSDAYARASAQSGAVFLTVTNHSANEDRLVSAASDVAERVELHTHVEDANGVMQMIEVEEGFAIPAEGTFALERGGDHIMLMGLTRPLADGDTFTVTLTFARGDTVAVEVTVDNARKPAAHGARDHGEGHGTSP
jgi:copper(I)-binding protein